MLYWYIWAVWGEVQCWNRGLPNYQSSLAGTNHPPAHRHSRQGTVSRALPVGQPGAFSTKLHTALALQTASTQVQQQERPGP